MQHLDSEDTLVGICLADPRMIEAVAARVQPDDFSNVRRGDLFRLLIELNEATPGAVDPAQVVTVLEDRGKTVTVADREEVRSLMAGIPHTAYAETHVEAVLERARRRRLRDAVIRANSNLDNGEKASSILRQLTSDIEEVQATRGEAGLVSSREASSRLHKALARRAEESHQSRLVPTTVPAATTMLGGGLAPGEMVVVAGRAGMGKSVFAECLADCASEIGPVLYASMEMSAEQMMQRAWARHSNAPLPNLRTARGEAAGKLHRLTEDLALRMASQQVFYVDDTDVDMHGIKAKAMGLKKTRGLSMVVVDYIGLLREPKDARSRQEAIAQASRFFKRMALQMDIPVVVVAQLNRELERRDDKRPKLSDLRESGALEQDADRVIALHRPSYYDAASPETDRILILKNRTGATGEVPAVFNPTQMNWIKPPFAD